MKKLTGATVAQPKLRAPKSQPLFGRWLNTALTRTGLSKKNIVKDFGCSRATVDLWLKGKNAPRSMPMKFLERYFDKLVPVCDYFRKKHIEIKCPKKAKEEADAKAKEASVKTAKTITMSDRTTVEPKNTRYAANQELLSELRKNRNVSEAILAELRKLNGGMGIEGSES